MKNRYQLVNYFDTSLSTSLVLTPSDSWTTTIPLVETPAIEDEKIFFLIIDPTSLTKRQIMKCYMDSWSIKIRNIDIQTWDTFDANTKVRLNDVASLFNTAYQEIDDFWKVIDDWGLDIIVYWGKIDNGWVVSILDTSVTLTNNDTNYVILDLDDNTLKAVVNLTWLNYYELATVSTSSWNIWTILDTRALPIESAWWKLDDTWTWTTDLWSADKIQTELDDKADQLSLDITDINVATNASDIDDLETDSHTHTNKTILDGVVAQPVEVITAGTNITVSRTWENVTVNANYWGTTIGWLRVLTTIAELKLETVTTDVIFVKDTVTYYVYSTSTSYTNDDEYYIDSASTWHFVATAGRFNIDLSVKENIVFDSELNDWNSGASKTVSFADWQMRTINIDEITTLTLWEHAYMYNAQLRIVNAWWFAVTISNTKSVSWDITDLSVAWEHILNIKWNKVKMYLAPLTFV